MTNDILVETVFLKKNEWKNLVYVTDDRDLAVGNRLKCKKKTKGQNCGNAAVNLTTQANRTVIDQKLCFGKNSNLSKSYNFPKENKFSHKIFLYATILKQIVRTVRPGVPLYMFHHRSPLLLK